LTAVPEGFASEKRIPGHGAILTNIRDDFHPTKRVGEQYPQIFKRFLSEFRSHMLGTMPSRTLPVLLVALAAASLPHFIHNAEFLADYPGLPQTWTRAGVYGAWVAMTLIGVCGWLLVRAGYHVIGLGLIAVYAVCGTDSLGHYVVAPLSAHTTAMNSTILLEVSAAALLLFESLRLLIRRVKHTV
jgi:hypothetical protein